MRILLGALAAAALTLVATADARAGWFRAALAVRPNNPTAWNSLGASYMDRNDAAAAAACFRRPASITVGTLLTSRLRSKLTPRRLEISAAKR